MKAFSALLISQTPFQAPKPSLAPPSQRNGAIIRALTKKEGAIVEIGEDPFAHNDISVLESLIQQLEVHMSSNDLLRNSKSHEYLLALLTKVELPFQKTFLNLSLTHNPKLLGAIQTNPDKFHIEYLASLKGGGGDLLAYVLRELQTISSWKLSSSGDNPELYFLRDGKKHSLRTDSFYSDFGFQPEKEKVRVIREEDLTPYAQQKMDNLQIIKQGKSFPLSQDLGLEDGNGIDYRQF